MSTRLYGAPEGALRRVTVNDPAAAKAASDRWPMITSYDALTAGLFDESGIPVMLVGDSAAMVVYGYDSTIPVTVDDLIPSPGPWFAAPGGRWWSLTCRSVPYQEGPAQALATATRFMKEAGAHAVKLEGGARVLPQIEALVAAGIPVMGHLGLTPQSVHALGGYKVQGRGEAGQILMQDAKNLQAAGAFAVVLEVVPHDLADAVTRSLAIPPSGSAPEPRRTPRCWCGRTWRASRPAARRSSSSSTPTCAACWAGQCSSGPRRSRPGRTPTPTTSTASPVPSLRMHRSTAPWHPLPNQGREEEIACG